MLSNSEKSTPVLCFLDYKHSYHLSVFPMQFTYIIFIFPTICRVGVIHILQMKWDLIQAE